MSTETVSLAVVRTQAGAARYGVPIGTTIGANGKPVKPTQPTTSSKQPDLLTPETHKLIKQYQASHGLAATGELDAQTTAYTKTHMANVAAAKASASAAKKAATAQRVAANKAKAAAKKVKAAQVRAAKAKASAAKKAATAKTRAAAKAATAQAKLLREEQAAHPITGKYTPSSKVVSMAVERVPLVEDVILAGKNGSKWEHGWIPENSAAVALKAHKKPDDGNKKNTTTHVVDGGTALGLSGHTDADLRRIAKYDDEHPGSLDPVRKKAVTDEIARRKALKKTDEVKSYRAATGSDTRDAGTQHFGSDTTSRQASDATTQAKNAAANVAARNKNGAVAKAQAERAEISNELKQLKAIPASRRSRATTSRITALQKKQTRLNGIITFGG